MHARRLVAALVLTGACCLVAAPVGSATTAWSAAPKPPRGYALVTSSTFLAPTGQQTRGAVTCPRGRVPLSGSAAIDSLDPFTSVNGSFPQGRQWVADVDNFSDNDVTFEVEAVCARPPTGYSVVNGPLAPSPGGTQASSEAECPPGTKPLGGGVATSSNGLDSNINSTIPDGESWFVKMSNSGGDAVNFSVRAVCGTLAGYTVVFGSGVVNPADTSSLSSASCPAPTVPIGGGAASNALSVSVNIGGMGPSGSDFVSSMHNASGVDFISSTYALCASR
jgi:hypothetical protein